MKILPHVDIFFRCICGGRGVPSPILPSWSITLYPQQEKNGCHRVAAGAISSVQFISVAQSCLALCDPMNCSTPGLPVHHQLLEFTQTRVHWVSDAIQPSHPRSSPSIPPIPPSIKVFSNESTLRMRWPKYWSFSCSCSLERYILVALAVVDPRMKSWLKGKWPLWSDTWFLQGD